MIEFLDLGIAIAALIVAFCNRRESIGNVFAIISLGFIIAFTFNSCSNKSTNQAQIPTKIQNQENINSNKNNNKKKNNDYLNIINIELNNEILNELGYQDKEKIISLNIPSIYEHNLKQYKIIGIEKNLFKDCKYLSNVTIPKSIIKIGDSAFENCQYLESVKISNSLRISNDLKEIGNSSFKNCISLKEITIPDGVKEIGNESFTNCLSLKNINIPKSIINIGDSAFENCQYLENVNILNGVKNIGNSSFKNCISLKELIIPNSAKEIGNNCFTNCLSLKNINIPENVTKIGDNAFENCHSLELIKIPNNVVIIGDNAFIDINEIEYYGKANGYPWGAKNVNKIATSKNDDANQNIKTENTESNNIENINIYDDPVEWESNSTKNTAEIELSNNINKKINISLEEMFNKHRQYYSSDVRNVVNSIIELTNIKLKDINLINDKISYIYNNNCVSENIGILNYGNAIKIYQMEYFFRPMQYPQNMAIALVLSEQNNIKTKEGIQVGDSEDKLKEIYKFDLIKTNSGYCVASEGLITLFKIENGIITRIFIYDAQLYKSGHSPAIVNLKIIIDELLKIENMKS